MANRHRLRFRRDGVGAFTGMTGRSWAGRGRLHRLAIRLGLSVKAEPCGGEDVLLRHRLLRAMQTIEDEFTEEAVADLALHLDVVFALLVDEEGAGDTRGALFSGLGAPEMLLWLPVFWHVDANLFGVLMLYSGYNTLILQWLRARSSSW